MNFVNLCNEKFIDFISYNQYLDLDGPLNNDIDVGYYAPEKMLLKSERVNGNICFKKVLKFRLNASTLEISGPFTQTEIFQVKLVLASIAF